MGRTKLSVVYRYFEVNDDNTSTCLMAECRKNLKTKHGANLLKHLKHMHKDLYKEDIEINNSRKSIDIQNKSNFVSNTVLKECTNLVAVHGRPFAMLNDKAFQNLLTMIPGNTATINTTNVKESVRLLAMEKREELAVTLQNKIISIKVDIASLASRSFMGINCQYISEGQIILKNLGVTEILQRHTSDHLKDLFVHNLQRFRIDTEMHKKIYCITTDNGANMIKMGKLLNEIDTAQAGPKSENTDISQLNLPDLEYENSDCYDDVEEIYTSQVTQIFRTQFTLMTGENTDYKIGIVRCAAHTIQLALRDACADEAFCNTISSCREVVRRLRTPQFVRILRENYKNEPKLDCSTRWHSIIDMVESLLSLRDICSTQLTDVRLHLSNSTWDSLTEIVKSLTPAKDLTKKLQEEELTVGDFYLAWMVCQFKLTKIKTGLSDKIVNSMKERQKLLFENEVFINGMFLDPRVNAVLTPMQQKKAQENLILQYISNFELEESNKENRINNCNAHCTSTDERSEAQMELDDFLNSSYINKHNDLIDLLNMNRDNLNMLNSLQQSLDAFLKEPLLQSTESVLKYWERSLHKFPLLYKLSSIVLAAPMTQVSVERLFSSLKFVVSNYRLSMKDDVIEDLLFLRSNNIFNK